MYHVNVKDTYSYQRRGIIHRDTTSFVLFVFPPQLIQVVVAEVLAILLLVLEPPESVTMLLLAVFFYFYDAHHVMKLSW